MRMKGRVASGVLRGGQLVEKYFFRIKAILGFEPYKGTLNVKLENPIEIEEYSTKAIEHILVDGTRMVEAHLAPIILHVPENSTPASHQRWLIGKVYDHECWAIRPRDSPHGKDIVEILDKEKLTERFSLKEGSEVEITFFEQRRKRESPAMRFMRRLYRREHRLSV